MQRRPLKTLAAQSTAQQLNSSTAQQLNKENSLILKT
jgi:hypothetical protein